MNVSGGILGSKRGNEGVNGRESNGGKGGKKGQRGGGGVGGREIVMKTSQGLYVLCKDCY